MKDAAKLLLATTLLVAGVLKLLSPDAFTESLRSFQLLPDSLLVPISQWIPTLEILSGILVLTKTYEGGGLATSTALFTSFTLFYLWALLFEIKPSCGCFGENPLLQVSPAQGFLRATCFAILSIGAWTLSLKKRKLEKSSKFY